MCAGRSTPTIVEVRGVGWAPAQLRWTCYSEMHNERPCCGSGAIEAGCETVVEERCTRSGMRWTNSAYAILDPRSCFPSEGCDKL